MLGPQTCLAPSYLNTATHSSTVAPAAAQSERVKQLEEEEALAECVFQPEISKLARALKAVDSDAGGAAWQRLYQRSQAAAKRQVGAGLSLSTAVRPGRGLREGCRPARGLGG